MPPATKEAKEDKFSLGMDCRPGIIGRGLNSFRELVNVIINQDNNIETRPPCLHMSGQLSSFAQGLVVNGGRFYTLARRGDMVVHSGAVNSLVTTLYFDSPENVLATWTLVQLEVFENQALAYVRHDFPGTTITSRLYLHVFDGLTNNPTYYADPAGPWDWGLVGFPTNAYGTGTGIPGAWLTFSPILTQAAEKVWSSRVDRNTAFSGIARARVWNSRSATDIEKTGAMYYFTVPAGGGAQAFAIPEPFADFADYQKFAGYVVETLNTDGSWTKVVETTGAPGAGQFQLVTGTRIWSSVAVAVISANGLTADKLLRIRILMTPEVAIVSGGVLTPGSETYRGDGASIHWQSTVPYVAFSSYVVKVNNSTKAATYYTVTNNNGLARIDFDSFSQVTDGQLTAGVITPGTGYTSYPAIALVGGSGGSGASAVVAGLKAVSAAVAAGGAGYTNGDVLTIVGDTGVAATFTATVAAGAVTGLALISGGIVSAIAANPHATSGGTGAGCTATVQYGVAAVTVTPGKGYVTAPTASFSGGAGAGAGLVITLAAPVGNTAIPYAAATDGDFGRLTVYYNGARKTETTDYTLVNSAGNTLVVPTSALAIGTQFDARMVVPLDILIEFASPLLALSAATIKYEANLQTAAAVLTSSLAPSSTYYVGVAANGVVGYKLTSAAWTGLERYQIYIIGTVTTDGAGNISATAPFQYGGVALTQWYNNRHQLNLDYWAGENEGGFVNSGTHDVGGSNVTSMVAIKNRLAIFYAQSTQLWQVDPAPSNCAFIDRYDFGSRYLGVNFYNRPLIYTQRGFRAFDLQGLNFQSLEEVNLGDPILSLGRFTVFAACFWPWRGAYVAFVKLNDSALYAEQAGLPADSIFWGDNLYGFVYLSFNKEEGISAWSFMPVAGLTSVSRMIALDDKIYCLQGADIWYFDDTNAVHRDGAGATVYEGVITWHLLPLGGKGSTRLLHVDLVQRGKATVSTYTMPWNAGAGIVGPMTTNTTMGQARIPLRGTGRAIGARLLTTDPNGLTLQSIRYEFMPLGR